MNALAHIRGLVEAAKHLTPRRMPRMVTTSCAHCGASVRFSRRVGKAWLKGHNQVCRRIQ
jgi:hypothetical protein